MNENLKACLSSLSFFLVAECVHAWALIFFIVVIFKFGSLLFFVRDVFQHGTALKQAQYRPLVKQVCDKRVYIYC